MPALLTIANMKTHLYPGVQNAITNNDNTIVQAAIDAAMTEAKGYCSRYGVSQLFDNPSPPDPTLLMYVKNIAKWHFIVLANPNIETEDALTRYDHAIRWLKDIQSGRTVPVGWPPITPAEKSTFFQMKSNRKRNNHFQ